MTPPVYTEKHSCRDCYKCVRACPVKAISIQEGSALVHPEWCIYCGKCVQICPAGAKKVRDDLPRARKWMELKKASVSLSPSFYGEYGDKVPRILHFLRKRGARIIGETALGAEAINRSWKGDKEERDRGILSSACPVIVRYIALYRPDLRENLQQQDSPMVVHGGLLKEETGKESPVIFIGPCIAKKEEADRHPRQVDVALTFQELDRWLEEEGLPEEEEELLPLQALEASLYPLEGGMIRSMGLKKARALSGIDHIMDVLQDWDPEKEPLFLECLSCIGGCINGPARKQEGSFLTRQERIFLTREQREAVPVLPEQVVLNRKMPPPESLRKPGFSEAQVDKALQELDKGDPANQLNCGSCGYPTCRDFALSWLMGKSEKEMCAGNMRKLAQKKVNALIEALPLAVVMVDRNLKIVELNGPFLSFFSDAELEDYQEINQRTRGLSVGPFAPLEGVLARVMEQPGQLSHQMKTEKGVFAVHCFNVEPGKLAGAVIEDVTQPVIRRETIISKAEEVIRKNLESVQQIASVLGENAAETEIILNSVIETLHPSGEEA